MKKIKLSFLLIVSLFIITSCSENETMTSSSSNESTDTSQNITDSTTETDVTEPTSDPNAEGFDIGNLAPDFEVELLSGETVKLSDFKGKAVILNFWATWCSPCKREMPDLQKIQDDYPEEVVVLGISIGEEKPLVEDFVEKNNYTFKIAADENGKNRLPYFSISNYLLFR
ncbi:TlpA family protein disulfide reductase [Miniphocaeibacter halophilus]|uniref:TlpA family protein disulfide reductase n=1 Tax=Miniphocaeibacter halophilus TaxID=2931922 RepID=A0AC61MRP3_9FIRM|nr:TlpA disulfide reductase family protein [Miniphocaeibacter halophilus]QQK07260.1 TlpA family protein disulfide reductase [Miniphocaeibacter halophilus]